MQYAFAFTFAPVNEGLQRYIVHGADRFAVQRRIENILQDANVHEIAYREDDPNSRIHPIEIDEEGLAQLKEDLPQAWFIDLDEEQPVATLVAVNGQPGPDGDFIVPFPHRAYTGKAGGETLLTQEQLEDLIDRGYQYIG